MVQKHACTIEVTVRLFLGFFGSELEPSNALAVSEAGSLRLGSVFDDIGEVEDAEVADGRVRPDVKKPVTFGFFLEASVQ